MKIIRNFAPPVLGLLLLAAATGAAANLASASDYGCLNCHGKYLRAEAPGLARLASKLARLQGDTVGMEKFVREFRSGAVWEHVDAHERISAQSATSLLRWLAEGAK